MSVMHYKKAFQKQGEKNIAYLCCSIGSCPWSPSNNGRPQLSVDQSKHYHYRANQQVGLVRLWSEHWALLLLIHSSESIYWLWIANRAPVPYQPNVVVHCLSWMSLIATCECFKRPTRPNQCTGDTSLVWNTMIKNPAVELYCSLYLP